MQNITLVLSAGATILLAGLIIAVGISSIPSAEGSLLGQLARIMIAVGVLGVGVMTLGPLRSEFESPFLEPLLTQGAMGLLVGGAAGSVWNLHLGRATGEFEYWWFPRNFLLMIQGALPILVLRRRGRHV